MNFVLLKKTFLSSIVFFGLFLISNSNDVYAANRYWVGPNGGSFHDSANWSATDPISCTGGGASVPGGSDVAIFDADCDSDVTITSNIWLSGLTMNSGYTGTVTGSEGIMVTPTTLTQAGGNLVVDILRHPMTSASFTFSGGTRTINVYRIPESASNSSPSIVIPAGQVLSVNSFEILSSVGSLTIPTNPGSLVTKDLIFGSDSSTLINTGVITITGNVTGYSIAQRNHNTASIIFSGNAVQNTSNPINSIAYRFAATITINKDGGSISFLDNFIVTTLNITQGTTNADFFAANNLNQTGGSLNVITLQHQRSGTFTFSGGTRAITNYRVTGTANNSATISVSVGQILSVDTFRISGLTGSVILPSTVDNFIVGDFIWDSGSTTFLNSANGRVNITGNLIGSDTAISGTNASTLYLVGSGNQTIQSSNSSTFGNLNIAKSGGSVNVDSSPTFVVTSFIQSGGTFNGGSGTITITAFVLSGTGVFNASTGTTTVVNNFTNTSGGTFNHNNGTVRMSANGTTDINSSMTFNNLEIYWAANHLTRGLGSNDTLVVNGLLTVSGRVMGSGSRINAYGDVLYNNQTSTADTSTIITILDDGSNTPRTVTFSGGDAVNVVINNPYATVNYNGTTRFASLDIQSGTFGLSGNDMTVNGNFIVDNNGTLQLNGNETLNKVPTINNGSTIEYAGTGEYTIRNWPYRNLSILGNASSDVKFTSGQTVTVAEKLIINGQPGSYILLSPTTLNSEWSINVSGIKDIRYVDVSYSNSANSIIAYDSIDSGNNTNWTFEISQTEGELYVSTFGRHVDAVLSTDTQKNIYAGGGFSLLRNSEGVSEISSVTVKQFGNFKTQYIKDFNLKYTITENSEICPVEQIESFDSLASPADFIQNEPELIINFNSIEISYNNRFCLYPYYRIDDYLGSAPPDAINTTIKFGLSATTSIAVDENTTVLFYGNSNSLTIPNATIFGSDGVATLVLTMSDPTKSPTVFYTQDGAMYKTEGEGDDKKITRLTSRDVIVQYARFVNLTPNDGRGKIKIKMLITHARDPAISQYYETTINLRK